MTAKEIANDVQKSYDNVSNLYCKLLERRIEEYAQHVSKEPKDNIIERKEKFTSFVLRINREGNNIIHTLEVVNNNGTSFIEYWTEKGEKDRKMRFEKQASFDIKRRLLTWKNNNYNNAKPTYTDKIDEYLSR